MFAELMANQFLVGMVGGAITAGAMYMLRALPEQIMNFFERKFIVKITVTDHDSGGWRTFPRMASWIMKNPEAKGMKDFRMSYDWDAKKKVGSCDLHPLRGFYFLHRYGRPWFVNVDTKENVGMNGAVVRQTIITVRTLGLSKDVAKPLMKDLARNNEGVVSITVFGGNDSFNIERPARPMHTIYLPDEQKDRIVGQIEDFYNKEEWYANAGIPWRTGFLFRGEPGTGKTSTIFALASHFNRPVFVVNLNSVKSDEELIDAVRECDSSFLVIEDFDGIPAARDRETIDPDTDKKGGVTISGILNAFDGLAAGEGRVLFLTTNHETQIDPALLRPGRVDFKETFELATYEVGLKMAVNLAGKDRAEEVLKGVEFPISHAKLQGHIFEKIRRAPE